LASFPSVKGAVLNTGLGANPGLGREKRRRSRFGKEAKVAEGTILALALLAAILIIDRLTK